MRTLSRTLMLGAACALMVSPAFAQKATDTTRPNQSAGKQSPGATTSESNPTMKLQPGNDSTTGSTQTPTQQGSDTTTRSSRPQMPAAKQPGSGTATDQSSMDHSKMSGVSQSPDKVKQVQEALKAKGQDPGPIDGVMGPHTARALRSYQKEQKIASSGQIDQPTLDALGISGTK